MVKKHGRRPKFLSFHSDYFSATKDRLSVMKTDENGFPFEKMDGKIEEFVELMEVVYPSRRKVTDENISYILALADRFLLDGVLRECEKYLMSDTCQTELCLKLYWSSQYNMNDLQEWCIAQLKTRQEIRAVKTSGFYKKLWETPNIMIALFDKTHLSCALPNMDDEPSRKRKADESPDISKVKVETRDMACSPIPELVSPEVSPAPAPQESAAEVSAVNGDVTREALPRIRVIDLDRTAKKTAKMEFVATRVNGVVSITAEPVVVKVSVANMDWFITLKINENGKLFCLWRINKKIYSNQWKIVACLEWFLTNSADPVNPKEGLMFERSNNFDSDGLRWCRLIHDDFWRPLVTLPETDYETVRTFLDLHVVLTIEEVLGFRLRHTFSYLFTEPSKDSDLVFRFSDGDEGKDLYISCSFLSFHSDYFSATRDRLAEMEKDENGFPLVKMDAELKMYEFIELMEIVYPSRRKLTDLNISFILPLADRFLFEGVLRKCEKFLMSESSQTDIFLKLYWASEYTMSDLQDWCFSQFKSRREINKVQKSEHYKKLKKTANIMTALYEKLADLPV